MEVNGWRLFVYPLFHSQLEKLADRVQKLASQDPHGYESHPAAKLLATINHYITEAIPRDPNSPEYRQGNTLGADNRHWFRAKFHGRYRLFYRFSSRERVIIYAWVNDEMSLRKAGAMTDPYKVFKTMLESAQPPNTFVELLKKSTELGARRKKE
jgi:toxin YhaV